jgi:hypothetical protein
VGEVLLGPDIVGDIPNTQDVAPMVWAARCSDPDHGLLGYFETRDDAEVAKVEHLRSSHASPGQP